MIILTIDTDWAPVEAVAEVLTKVKALGVKCTVFFSAPSPVEPWPELEMACHPDLSRRVALGQSQGEALSMATPEHDAAVNDAESSIIGSYRTAFPTAGAIRTHRFYWHSDLSRLLATHGFAHDSSLIMPYHPGLCGFQVGKLKRWPVWASDHLHLARRLPLDRLAMPNWSAPGLKIFCFHVAYLYLNAASLNDFNLIENRFSADHLSSIDWQAPGVWRLFEMLAEEINRHSAGGHWLSEIPDNYIVSKEIV